MPSIKYAEFTYRKGKPMAGYLYLDEPRSKSARCMKADAGLIVDFASDGHPIGVEITSPSMVTLDAVNRVLKSLNLEPASERDLAPLTFAA